MEPRLGTYPEHVRRPRLDRWRYRIKTHLTRDLFGFLGLEPAGWCVTETVGPPPSCCLIRASVRRMEERRGLAGSREICTGWKETRGQLSVDAQDRWAGLLEGS